LRGAKTRALHPGYDVQIFIAGNGTRFNKADTVFSLQRNKSEGLGDDRELNGGR
jgi:hypothetical protein